MGYRSDVAIALTKNGMAKFKDWMESQKTSYAVKEQISSLLGWANKHLSEPDGSECWYWKQIKWYNNWPDYFADIDFFEKLMKELDENDFYFIRIGEDYDDIEVKGFWYDNPFGLSLTRQIVLDC